MSPANWLTLLRIFLIPVFVTSLLYHRMGWALLAFLAAAVTDFLDGYVARRTRTTSLGRFLDPTADKLLLVSAFVILPLIDGIPLWVTVVVVSRDVFLAAGYLIIYFTWGTAKITVRPLGKITTFVQSFCVAWTVLASLVTGLSASVLPVAYGTALVTVLSWIDYMLLGFRQANALHDKRA